jgi:hypothetical protein
LCGGGVRSRRRLRCAPRVPLAAAQRMEVVPDNSPSLQRYPLLHRAFRRRCPDRGTARRHRQRVQVPPCVRSTMLGHSLEHQDHRVGIPDKDGRSSRSNSVANSSCPDFSYSCARKSQALPRLCKECLRCELWLAGSRPGPCNLLSVSLTDNVLHWLAILQPPHPYACLGPCQPCLLMTALPFKQPANLTDSGT